MFPLAAALLSACGGAGRNARSGASVGDTLQMRHAQLLTIVEYGDYTTVDVADPWHKGKTLHRYRIENARPVRSALVTTSVHCALFDELGCRDRLTGVCDLQYIHLPWVQQGCREGRIVDCGNSLEPTVEVIASLQPDAIFLSPFQNSGGYGRVEQLGVEIVEMADYMETSALGRAEWVRFYARLLGQRERGDSLFAVVERSYNDLKAQAKAKGTEATTLLMDKMVGQVWYVPGGRSTTGRMLADAGAAYPWAGDSHSGSLALPLEEVLDKGGVALQRPLSPDVGRPVGGERRLRTTEGLSGWQGLRLQHRDQHILRGDAFPSRTPPARLGLHHPSGPGHAPLLPPGGIVHSSQFIVHSS